MLGEQLGLPEVQIHRGKRSSLMEGLSLEEHQREERAGCGPRGRHPERFPFLIRFLPSSVLNSGFFLLNELKSPLAA